MNIQETEIVKEPTEIPRKAPLVMNSLGIKVYLAGGMNEHNWQNKVMESVKKERFVFFNPREHSLTDSKEYTTWDLFYVRNCDVLFGYMEKDNPSGIGLALEVGFASALNKPIILVDEKSETDESFSRKFRIVNESSTIIFNNLKDGINFLAKFQNGIFMP